MEPDGSVPVAGNPAPWTNVDRRGIDIAAEAARAAAAGYPARNIIVTGLSGMALDADLAAGGTGFGLRIEFRVSADGAVTMRTEGYEPVIEDGWITEFRRTGGG